MEVMENIRLVLRSNLRRLREGKGWNQDKLAEKSGLSVGMIKNVELGNRWPSPATTEAITKALEVPVSALFGESETIIKKEPISIFIKKIASIPDDIFDLAIELEGDKAAWDMIRTAMSGEIRRKAGNIQEKKSV